MSMPRKAASRSRATARMGQGVPAPQPDVILDFLFDAGLLFVSIQNIGERPALNVSVEFDRPLVGLGGRRQISDLPLFKNLEFLAPRKAITAFLDTAGAYFARREPTKIFARIAFHDSEGRAYGREIRHDLEIYREIGYVVAPASLRPASSVTAAADRTHPGSHPRGG
jgi:hypothetical protein